jgi:hypothetical protein
MFSFLYHCQDFYRTWLYIWVTWRVSYRKQELLTFASTWDHSRFWWGPCWSTVVLLCVFTFWVSCCDVRLIFPHGSDVRFVFASSCLWGARVLFTLFVCMWWCPTCDDVQHILCCIFDLFFFVLCTLCCQFLWIVHLWLPLRYSLTFIVNIDQLIRRTWPRIRKHFLLILYLKTLKTLLVN